MSDQDKVDALKRELDRGRQSDPALAVARRASAMADQAQDAVRSAQAQLGPSVDALSSRIKGRPFAAVAIAAGLGYLLGRTTT